MTQQEILEYNKNVYRFLGYEYSSSDKIFYFVIHPETRKLEELNFDRKYINNWNYIMKLVEAIQMLETKYPVSTDEVLGLQLRSSKEAVVQAINQFLIWHNAQVKNP